MIGLLSSLINLQKRRFTQRHSLFPFLYPILHGLVREGRLLARVFPFVCIEQISLRKFLIPMLLGQKEDLCMIVKCSMGVQTSFTTWPTQLRSHAHKASQLLSMVKCVRENLQSCIT